MYCLFFINTVAGCVVVMGSTIDATNYDAKFECNSWEEMIWAYCKVHTEHMEDGRIELTAWEVLDIVSSYK